MAGRKQRESEGICKKRRGHGEEGGEHEERGKEEVLRSSSSYTSHASSARSSFARSLHLSSSPSLFPRPSTPHQPPHPPSPLMSCQFVVALLPKSHTGTGAEGGSTAKKLRCTNVQQPDIMKHVTCNGIEVTL